MMKKKNTNNGIMADALRQSIKKLSPRIQVKNPVMLVVYIGAVLTTVLYFLSFAGIRDESAGYTLAIALILWFTVLFANFAEAIAEGRGRAQADSLRSARKDVKAKRLKSAANVNEFTEVLSNSLKKGDIVYVQAGEQIPMDGEVIDGAASVDESAITGESAPVIRESGGDRSAVTGGTTLVSDWLVVKVTAEAGESFLDKMIAMVEGASRKKTPNEIALQILLVTLTIIFLVVTATLLPFSAFASLQIGAGAAISITNVIALLVCLAPTTIGALLSSIGIAGMSRLNQANVLAMSGRAIEAAGDVDVLLLDKTGTITLGNRQAAEFIPLPGINPRDLADAAVTRGRYQFGAMIDGRLAGVIDCKLAEDEPGLASIGLLLLAAPGLPNHIPGDHAYSKTKL
jgi:K+-transporting ATPase ATPase B chain